MVKNIICTILLFILPLTLRAQTAEEEKIIDIDYTANEWNTQAHALIEQGQYEAAKPLLKKAIARNPEVLIYYENLAIACKSSADQEGLLSCYALAKKNMPEEPSVFYYSGDVLQNAEQYEEAIADYNRAIELAGKDTELLHLYYFNRGNTWLKLREYKNARADYDKSLMLNEYHQASYVNRATARYKLRDADGACADWAQAYQLGYQAVAQYQRKYCQ